LARASLRVFRAGALLGLFGLASFVVVFTRLLERWHVTTHTVSHHVAILGQRLAYPAANAAALTILVLAGLGAIVTLIALAAIGREVLSARRLARRLAELHPVARDGVLVIDDERREAFCAGLLRPRVYVTTGAIASLDEPGLNAVLLHERHHARRRDPLRLAATRVIERSLFFLPGLRQVREGQQLLAELGADESAVADQSSGRSALAGAMLSFSEVPDGDGSAGLDPARVDVLLGQPPSWRFPAMLCLAAAALLAIIVTTAILVGREAAGSATLAPPFLSAQPCIVMLALIPWAIGLGAVLLIRILRRRSQAGELSRQRS
jgi:hypothetical protein